MAQELTIKQRAFINEYMIDKDGMNAAIRAGYSPRSAKVIASELLDKPLVRKELERILKNAEKKAETSVADILRKINLIASTDIRELFNDDGSLKLVSQWPESVARAVSAVEIDELFKGVGQDREQVGWTKKIKLWDKVKALEMLGRHFKMFIDRVEVTGDADFIDALNKAKKRGEQALGK